MIKTFAYLILHTWRNRFVAMGRRVRKPKYALGLIVGIAYFGFIFWNANRGPRTGSVNFFANDIARTLSPVILVLLLASTWFGGTTLNALAFSAAEISLLFPAPVTRRGLILYKLAAAQVPILINAVLLTYIFGRGPAAVPHSLRVLSLWLMFSTLQLHRLGAALVSASTYGHGVSGLKRNWLSQAIGIVIMVVIMMPFFAAPAVAANGSNPFAFMQQIADLFKGPAVQTVLFPFALIRGPSFSRTIGEWAGALPGAFAMFALHLIWVLRSQTAFEEAAIEVSEKRRKQVAAWRTRGAGAAIEQPRETGGSIRMGAAGNPAFAILWKNTLCMLRTFRPMQLLSSLVAPAFLGFTLGRAGKDPALVVASVSGIMMFMLFLTGGTMLRNDLRADLLHLSQLKTLPLRGRDLVFAEIASSALPLAAIQFIVGIVGVVALQLSTKAQPLSTAVTLAALLPIALVALNLTLCTVQNGIAVAFPAWIRLGVEGTGPGALEVMGQTMLTMLTMLLSLLLLLVVPAAVTAFIVIYVKPPLAIAAAFSVLVGAAALFGETYGIIAWVGRMFEKMEPSAAMSPT